MLTPEQVASSSKSKYPAVAHRAMRSIYKWLGIYFLMLVAMLVISRNFAETILTERLDFAGGTLVIEMPLLGLFAALALFRALALYYNHDLVIGYNYIRSVDGICSWHREVMEIPYEAVLGVHVRQKLTERILGVGSLVVGTAMTDQPELIVDGIENPEYYARLIRDRVDNVHKDRRISSLGQLVNTANLAELK